MKIKRYLRNLAQRLVGQPQPQPGFINTSQDRQLAIELALHHIRICRRNLTTDEGKFGNYAEFGVFKGNTFAHATLAAQEITPGMQCFAFDSFEGLPNPSGIDAGSEFNEAQFKCSLTQFQVNLRKKNIDFNRVHIVPGWFSETLKDGSTHGLTDVSLAYIDCDLYESTVPVLNYLTDKISQGTLLFFDDWFCFRANPSKGVQLAAKEWLKENPNIRLIPWRMFSHHGQAFFVDCS